MESTWTFFLRCFRRSFWATPKRCSSSTIIRASFGISMSFESSRWVPTRMSTSPDSRRPLTSLTSAALRKREIISTFTGKPSKRPRKVSTCWSARMVVGASTATW